MYFPRESREAGGIFRLESVPSGAKLPSNRKVMIPEKTGREFRIDEVRK